MNDLIYEPNLTDRVYWERRMFRIVNPPPKLDSWQDYIIRYKQGDEDFFAVFLHYYEPALNKTVKRFGSRYGLIDHFADLKMAYVATMLTLLQNYDPDCGIDFLLSVRRKLRDALHAYTITNLKGFSETSPERYRQLRKAAYLYKNSAPGEEVRAICDALAVKPKTAQKLIREIEALDTFRWNGGTWETESGTMETLPGIDILGYTRPQSPEQVFLHNERQRIITAAFEELDEKKQGVIGLSLGFCHNCFGPIEPKTNDEIADIYQFTSENGVHRCYKGALKKLKAILADRNFFSDTD
jgi:RNA polymerase sigma factor (sigma-70 family)